MLSPYCHNSHILRAIQEGIGEMIYKHQAVFTLDHIPEHARPILQLALARIGHTFAEMQDETQKVVQQSQNSLPKIIASLHEIQITAIHPNKRKRANAQKRRSII